MTGDRDNSKNGRSGNVPQLDQKLAALYKGRVNPKILNNKQLAEAISISSQAISSWKKPGGTNPSSDNLRKLCIAFGIRERDIRKNWDPWPGHDEFLDSLGGVWNRLLEAFSTAPNLGVELLTNEPRNTRISLVKPKQNPRRLREFDRGQSFQLSINSESCWPLLLVHRFGRQPLSILLPDSNPELPASTDNSGNLVFPIYTDADDPVGEHELLIAALDPKHALLRSFLNDLKNRKNQTDFACETELGRLIPTLHKLSPDEYAKYHLAFWLN